MSPPRPRPSETGRGRGIPRKSTKMCTIKQCICSHLKLHVKRLSKLIRPQAWAMSYQCEHFKNTRTGNFEHLWYPFFDPPFLWSQMVKNYFFTIENPFRGFFWAQQYPKRPFENHWSSFSGKDQKWKNRPKSHFLVIDYLETWSACSLQLFCVLKAVKPQKRVL